MKPDHHYILELMQQEFGLSGELCALPGYADDNFRLDGAEQSFVIKFASANADPGEQQMQNAVLEHLQVNCPDINLPRPQQNLNGQTLIKVDLFGQQRLLRVLSYIEGKVYANVEQPDRELQTAVGQLLGQIDVALADFHHAAATRTIDWDLAQLQRLRPWVGCINDPKVRDSVNRAMDDFDHYIIPAAAELPTQVVHNDANDYNIVVNDKAEGGYALSLIDFGDMVHTIRVAELAVALPYIMFGRSDPVASAAAVISGYKDWAPLMPVELELLYYLINGRLCNSLIMSSRTAAQQPEDEYIMISAKPAVALLEFMQKLGKELFLLQMDVG